MEVEALRSDAHEHADDSLVAAALADRARFADIYERFRLPVYRYVRAHGLDEDATLDVVAGTFERALAALSRYRPRGGGLGAWLFRIARNAVIDERRRRARHRDLSDAADRPALDRTGRDPDLALALARLPEPAREAIALRYAGGLTSREIGEVLGKRPAAVQKLIERSLETLREALDDR
jgi:RNA polymerase sigma-70 factor, ECF subfamily